MKIGVSKKVKIVFWLSLCMSITPLTMSMSVADNNNRIEPGEAVIEYRNLLEQSGEHQPRLLREVLYMQLEHKDTLVRRGVAEVIGELNEPDTLDTIWNIFVKEKSWDVRHAAVTAMHEFGDKSAVKYLVRALNDENVLVRREAAFGCGDVGDESALIVLEKAFYRERDEFNKLAIASSMVILGDRKKVRFIENSLLNNTNPEIRRYVGNILAVRGITLNNKILKDAMNREKDPYVKVWIACTLASQGDSPMTFYLRNIVSKSKIAELKSQAAYALTEIEDFEYVYPFLVELLKEKTWKIRERAIEDLVNFKEFPLEPILGNIHLTDESIIVREIAAWALGERKDEIALPYLEKGLYDDSAFVRTGVVAAIYKILNSGDNKNREK